MIGTDPLHLAGPARSRKTFVDVEQAVASLGLAAVRATVGAQMTAGGGGCRPQELLEAALAGLVQAYAVVLAETGALGALESQTRIMARALTLAEFGRTKATGEHVRLQAVILQEVQPCAAPAP